MSDLKMYKDKHICKFDYIVIGSGTAGSIIGRDLSDNTNNSVLIIEEGQYKVNDPEILNTQNPFAVSFDPKFSVNLPTVPEPGLGGQQAILRYAVTVGGSSAHYYLLTVYGSPQFFTSLIPFGGPGWSYDNAINIYKQLQDYDGPITPNSVHAVGGPIGIRQNIPAQNAFMTIIPTLMAQLSPGDPGVPIAVDYNNRYNNVIGLATQQFIQRNGNRSFTGRDFLGPGIVTPNGIGLGGRKLRLLTSAFVNRIIFDDKLRARAVEVVIDGQTFIFRARKRIILSAGSLNTPLILMRSGIGPADLLTSLGINTLVNNPNVGNHLRTHYGTTMLLNVAESQFVGTSNTSNIVAFLNLLPGETSRRVQYIVAPGVIGIPPTLFTTLGIPPNPPPGRVYLTCIIWDLKPLEGTIKLSTPESHAQPTVNINFYSDSIDVTTIRNAVLLMKNVFDVANASNPGDYLVSYPPPSAFTNVPISLDPFLPIALSTADHYSGTARMGHSIVDSVVNGETLEVFNVDRLMVGDNSIFPIIPDGNTGFPAMYVGKRAIQIIQNSGL